MLAGCCVDGAERLALAILDSGVRERDKRFMRGHWAEHLAVQLGISRETWQTWVMRWDGRRAGTGGTGVGAGA